MKTYPAVHSLEDVLRPLHFDARHLMIRFPQLQERPVEFDCIVALKDCTVAAIGIGGSLLKRLQRRIVGFLAVLLRCYQSLELGHHPLLRRLLVDVDRLIPRQVVAYFFTVRFYRGCNVQCEYTNNK